MGRSAEYAALVGAYQQARRDGLQVFALVGNAGMGKSRLAQQFVDWAANQGADVLRGWAFATSGGLPYQPLTQLLRQRLERENAPDDLLSDLWLTQLTRILPELRERYPDLPEPTQEEATARQHLFEAITRLGQALAARAPLILWLDDWHWADAASLDVLHYAVQRWAEERAPILVLLTLRQEALAESPELQTWLAQLQQRVAGVQLPLTALSQAETAQLVRRLFAPEAGADAPSPTRFGDWLFAETDGQPLFLVETLKSLVEEGVLRPAATVTSWEVDWPLFDARGAAARVAPGVRAIIRGWLGRISARRTWFSRRQPCWPRRLRLTTSAPWPGGGTVGDGSAG